VDWLYTPTDRLRARMPGWKSDAARTMRANPTPAEARLWQALRARQLAGKKFRRQVLMLGFIVDFYCAALGLVVEVDGPQHDAAYDAWRDTIFAQHGIHVVRVSNTAVMRQLPVVLKRLRAAMFERPFQRRVGKELHQLAFGPDSASAAGDGSLGSEPSSS
jgi:very-short-patch-repair endonuclease